MSESNDTSANNKKKRPWSGPKNGGKKSKRDEGKEPAGESESPVSDQDNTDTKQKHGAGGKRSYVSLANVKGHAAVLATCEVGKEAQANKELLALLDECCEALGYTKTAIESLDGGAGSKTLSIEDMIQQEIRQHTTANTFRVVNSEMPGIVIACLMEQSSPIDVVAVLQNLFDDIKQSGVRRSRFLIRLSPLTMTSYADLENFERIARPMIEQYFAEDKPDVTSWAVSLQRHSTGLPRDETVKFLAGVVPPKYKVDLKKPQVTVVVEGVKNMAGISIVPNGGRGRQCFNIRAHQDACCSKKAQKGPT